MLTFHSVTVLLVNIRLWKTLKHLIKHPSFPVAQLVEHGASNAKIMGSIPKEKQELIKCRNLNAM